MADISRVEVRDGTVIGHVRTNVVGSECDFEVCSVEQWEEMSEDEAEKALQDAAFESGYVEIW